MTDTESVSYEPPPFTEGVINELTSHAETLQRHPDEVVRNSGWSIDLMAKRLREGLLGPDPPPFTARKQVDFHIPCGYERVAPHGEVRSPLECKIEAIGRIHHPDDDGLASTYVCGDHIEWGHAWVYGTTGNNNSVFTEFSKESETKAPTLDDVVCPACINVMKEFDHYEDGVPQRESAECLACGYDIADEATTVREMLDDPTMGSPTWTDVNLPAYTRWLRDALENDQTALRCGIRGHDWGDGA